MADLTMRVGDSCPACGSTEVFEGVETKAHGGSVFIDGCASCLKLWERETREKPGAEPCTNCAWLPGSPEMLDGRMYGIADRTIDGSGVFYCHRRVPFQIVDGKAAFEHQIGINGKRCTNASVCAGWIKAKLWNKRLDRQQA